MKQEAASITNIDKDHLDKECVELPTDYRRFAFLAAEAKRDVQEAKAALDVTGAELANQIRSDPPKFGLEKITESVVKETVLLQPVYKKVQAELFKCQHASEMTTAVVWAIEHKKRALTLLVELHGLGYFSSVHMTQKGREAVQEMTKRNVRRRHQKE